MKLFAFLGLCLVFSAVAYAGDGGDERICDPCMAVEGWICPMDAWQVIEGSTIGQPGNDPAYAYGFTAAEGMYHFTFCMEGGWAGFDTGLSIQGPENCGPDLACNDDFCGLQSELEWFCSAVYAGETMIISVDGFGTATGDYGLAYRGPEGPSPVEQTAWGKVKMLFH